MVKKLLTLTLLFSSTCILKANPHAVRRALYASAATARIAAEHPATIPHMPCRTMVTHASSKPATNIKPFLIAAIPVSGFAGFYVGVNWGFEEGIVRMISAQTDEPVYIVRQMIQTFKELQKRKRCK